MLDKSTIVTQKKLKKSLLIVYKAVGPAYVLYYYIFYAKTGMLVLFFYYFDQK